MRPGEPPSSLGRILRADCCAGCGLCASLSSDAIEMRTSAEGFLRPVATGPVDTARDDLICEVCPGIRLSQTNEAGVRHPIWGPVVSARTGHATDAALRFHASSGGALSAFADFLLRTGEVDFVMHTAAAADSPIRNRSVVSVDSDDVFRAAGSRYAPSSPLDSLDRHLGGKSRFAVVGKPCDIAAVRALARRDPRVAERIPVLVSFFCAGVPSIEGTRRILDAMGVDEADVERFSYRGDGWPGDATAVTRDGREHRMSYDESWGQILRNHVQFRCKICPDGSGGFADISFGDAWYHDEDGNPLFENADGRSLIVTRTPRGEDLLSRAAMAGVVSVEPLPVDDIERIQPSQAERKRLVLSRLVGMLLAGSRPPRYRGLNLVRAALGLGPLATLRSLAGTYRRSRRRRVSGPDLADLSA